MYKLGFEEAEKPEIKLSTFTGSWRKQGNFRKNVYFWFIHYTTVFDSPSLAAKNIINLISVRKQQLELDMEQQTGSK